MSSFNILDGNVGKDPEIRLTNNNTKVATFSLAVTREYQKDKDKQVSDWFTCVAWGDQADIVEQQVGKGMHVFVVGKFQTRNYDDKDGKRVYVTEFFVDRIARVLAKSNNIDASYRAQTTNVVTDEDLPF